MLLKGRACSLSALAQAQATIPTLCAKLAGGRQEAAGMARQECLPPTTAAYHLASLSRVCGSPNSEASRPAASDASLPKLVSGVPAAAPRAAAASLSPWLRGGSGLTRRARHGMGVRTWLRRQAAAGRQEDHPAPAVARVAGIMFAVPNCCRMGIRNEKGIYEENKAPREAQDAQHERSSMLSPNRNSCACATIIP